MTDQQQRNADIAASVEHALNQKDIDAREWQAQSKQWEAVTIAQRKELDALHAAAAQIVASAVGYTADLVTVSREAFERLKGVV